MRNIDIMIRSTLYLLVTVLLVSANASDARADVKPAALFSDHAVLQAGKLLNIWGTADNGEHIQVNLAGKTAETVATADGKWSVTLPPLAASGPQQDLVVRGRNTVRVTDVLIGEVWLCAGQSNMAMPLKGSFGGVEDAADVVAKADHPTLRMFVHDERLTIRIPTVPPDAPQSDRAGKWIVCTPQTAASFTAMGYFFARNIQDQIDAPVGLILCASGGTSIEAWTGLPAQQAQPELQPMLVDWQNRLKGYDPVAGYEKATAAKVVWQKQRAADVAAGLKPGKAPRETDYQNLAANKPAGLFNGMIAPLIPYTIRGVLWYQGEHNANGPFTSLYGRQLQTLITDWRGQWKDDFYFAFVQLPRYQKPQTKPSEDDGWGVWVREGQRKTLAQIPNTAMAITIDLGGEGPDFAHPKNKNNFAKRVAALALNDVYSKPNPLRSGPVFRAATPDGNRMVIDFDFAEGLAGAASGTKPKGFAIAGDDRKFVWADAEIRGNQVVVWSDPVPNPKSVRYSWAANPLGDLHNAAGLPCSPFRTDDWLPAVKSSANPTE